MCTLKPPFQSNSLAELYSKIQKGKYEEISARYSSDLHLMLRNCLQVDPMKRPSCIEVLQKGIFKNNMGQTVKNLGINRANSAHRVL